MKILEGILTFGLIISFFLLFVYDGWILTFIMILDIVLLLGLTFYSHKIAEKKSRNKEL